MLNVSAEYIKHKKAPTKGINKKKKTKKQKKKTERTAGEMCVNVF